MAHGVPEAGTYTPWACSRRPREQRFGESGLSRDEFDEAERQQRLRDLSVTVEIQRDGAADPPDVADALSLRHWGGPPVRPAVLLSGSHLAETQADVDRLCKSREGRELAAGWQRSTGRTDGWARGVRGFRQRAPETPLQPWWSGGEWRGVHTQ